MMRRLYDWMMRMAAHRKAPQALFWVSFIESSFFPIPPDVMLIPMILANRAKAWFYATIATVGSVIGGIAGYAIGYFFFEYVGEPILTLYGYGDRYKDAAAMFQEWGVVDPDRQGLDAVPLQGADHCRRRRPNELHPVRRWPASWRAPCASIWWRCCSTSSASRSATSSSAG